VQRREWSDVRVVDSDSVELRIVAEHSRLPGGVLSRLEEHTTSDIGIPGSLEAPCTHFRIEERLEGFVVFLRYWDGFPDDALRFWDCEGDSMLQDMGSGRPWWALVLVVVLVEFVFVFFFESLVEVFKFRKWLVVECCHRLPVLRGVQSLIGFNDKVSSFLARNGAPRMRSCVLDHCIVIGGFDRAPPGLGL